MEKSAYITSVSLLQIKHAHPTSTLALAALGKFRLKVDVRGSGKTQSNVAVI